ncbi:MAG: sulfotransferase family protein [Chitinivibrionales bacterium]|nr:sulfotransferase family protein [Chitinivibrionales bacterium]
MRENRSQNYARNENLENLLKELSELLGPVEDFVESRFNVPRYPILFVVGGPRSGSTVTMQFLAASGAFAYPSNLLSRFYRAPYVGARIQQMLTDPAYDFKGEFQAFQHTIPFDSDLGKSKGVLAPNEFWYYWRRFIPIVEPSKMTPEQEPKVNTFGFAAGFAAIESVFNKPVATKGMLLEQNIPFVDSIFSSGALFLNMHRKPFYNIQSLLECREKFFGDRKKWYSIKTPQYEELSKLDPIAQVVGQVYFKNKEVESGLNSIPDTHSLTIAYEDFCENPSLVYKQIQVAYSSFGVELPIDYTGPERLTSGNVVRLTDSDVEAIRSAWKEFGGEDLDL